MRICFVGPANSAHITKWCSWFVSEGHEVHVISFTPGEIEGTEIHLVNVGVDANDNDFKKLKYLFSGRQIRKLIKDINPDVINAHYATSYGISTALSGISGYALSVWGSDIYEFPRKSIMHRILLKYSLRKAGYLFSTSQAMADEASRYTDRKFHITPFGVDMTVFNPDKRTRESEEPFTIGTVKGLSEKYGIRYIIEASEIIKKQGMIPIKVKIAGKGPQEEEYRNLADEVGVTDIIDWLGFISPEKAAEEWANMDVAIIPSEAESFGVSAVEAQACGTPLVITNVPGLLEVTNSGETSVVIKGDITSGIVDAICLLYKDTKLRKTMAAKGIEYVREKYELNRCFANIQNLLEDIKNSQQT